jgi:transposase
VNTHPPAPAPWRGSMTIAAVGPTTALTWALEVGDVKRFSSIKEAISYCGLCSAEKSSADVVNRPPLSKKLNKHLQRVLIEAAKMAPRGTARPWRGSITKRA